MQPWGWLSMPAGGLLAVVVLADVFLTVMHPDLEGRIAKALQRACWNAAVAVGEQWQGARRQLLALAGPLMTVLTFAVWIGLFIVGIALMVWPNLSGYRVEPELGPLTFVDALYYAGVTVTVLGYGDLSPFTGWMQTLAFVASGSGFVLLTGIVTYLIELVGSIDVRHRLSLQVHDDTGGTQEGAQLPVRYLRDGTLNGLIARYEDWAMLCRQVQDKLHRYALTSLYYRARDPIYDPEATFRVLGEAVVAGYLVAGNEGCRGLRLAVEHLDLAVARLLGTVAEQYLGKDTMRQLESPQATDTDQRWVADLRQRLRAEVGHHSTMEPHTEHALAAAVRTRVFLRSLAHLTHWAPEDDP